MLHQRYRSWLGIASLASKLGFMADILMGDRVSRPMRQLRKEAAIRIAKWYKSILLRRYGHAQRKERNTV